MWYILWVKDGSHDWTSVNFPEEVGKKIPELIESGVLEDEILILNLHDTDNIMTVNELKSSGWV